MNPNRSGGNPQVQGVGGFQVVKGGTKLLANKALLVSGAIDVSLFYGLVLYIDFTAGANPANGWNLIMLASPDNETASVFRNVVDQAETLAASTAAGITVPTNARIMQFPAATGSYTIPLDVDKLIFVQFAFQMQNANDQVGTLANATYSFAKRSFL